MRVAVSTFVVMLLSVMTGFAQHLKFSPQWTPQSQFAGYYAAQENGYYAEAGLSVQFKHPTASFSSMSMIEDGKTDIITSELIQAMMTNDKGQKLVNILQTTQHSTLVLIARDKNVDELSDLAGDRIGTWKVGFSEIPHMIDQEQGLGIEWVKLINSLNTYISGAIDGTLAKSYNELILFRMAGITPGSVFSFRDLGFDFPEDGLYVTEEFYKANKDMCRRFVEASRKGWEWVRNNREAALDIVMKYVKYENVATNRYVQKWMLDDILEAQQDEGQHTSYELSRDDFERLNEVLLKYGYISAPLDYDRFIGVGL